MCVLHSLIRILLSSIILTHALARTPPRTAINARPPGITYRCLIGIITHTHTLTSTAITFAFAHTRGHTDTNNMRPASQPAMITRLDECECARVHCAPGEFHKNVIGHTQAKKRNTNCVFFCQTRSQLANKQHTEG